MATAHDDSNRPRREWCVPDIVARPSFQLRSLPIEYRWEVTRRHPYYQNLWLLARAHYRNEPITQGLEGIEELFRQTAAVFLGMIGVSGEPVDPATEFSDLGEPELERAWLSGAVHPITLRSMAAMLIAALPKETLGHVGLCVVQASCDDEENAPPRRSKAMMDLAKLDKPGLDSYLDEPIVSVNPAASGRQINEAVSELIKAWKSERELKEQRDRSDKYPDYLHVWDMREGWTGSAYDRSREKKLREVATELGLAFSMVKNHYRSAFEMIVGQPYSPGLWIRVFWVNKFADLTGEDIVGPVTRRRPLVSPTRRPSVVPESVLLGDANEDEDGNPISFVDNLIDKGPAPDDFNAGVDAETLIERICGLLDKEPDDARIASLLDLGSEVIPAIAELRRRAEELG